MSTKSWMKCILKQSQKDNIIFCRRKSKKSVWKMQKTKKLEQLTIILTIMMWISPGKYKKLCITDQQSNRLTLWRRESRVYMWQWEDATGLQRNEPIDRPMDKQTNGQMNQWTDRPMDWQTERRTNHLLEICSTQNLFFGSHGISVRYSFHLCSNDVEIVWVEVDYEEDGSVSVRLRRVRSPSIHQNRRLPEILTDKYGRHFRFA